MKLNKMTLIAVLALGGLLPLGTAAYAQDAATNAPAMTTTTPPARGRMVTAAQLATLLALTDEQKTNVDAVLKDQRAKMRDLRTDTTLSTEDRREKMKTIRDEANAKMKAILTPEQYAKYLKTMPGRRPPAAAPAAAATTGN